MFRQAQPIPGDLVQERCPELQTLLEEEQTDEKQVNKASMVLLEPRACFSGIRKSVV